MIQALTDERTGRDTDEWISQLKIVVRADRRTRKQRVIQEPASEPTTEGWMTDPSRSQTVLRTSSIDGLAVGCAGSATDGVQVHWRRGARTSSW